MIKTYEKVFFRNAFGVVLSIVFLFSVSLCAPTNKIYAAGLEVQYPTISGENPNTDTNLTLTKYVKYIYDGGMFIGFFAVFISLTVAGAMYFLSPISAEFKTRARDMFSGAISGLLILVTTYLIITTINPQLSFFNFNQLNPAPMPAGPTEYPGVYFYHEYDCSNDRAQPNASNISDLGLLKNKINSVGIIKGSGSYISILYDKTNFWGKCQYINGSAPCQTVNPFAASASIYRFDFDPNGDGVYFYRKSYFNNGGGYLYIPNDTIKNAGSNNLYVGNLNQLQFTGDLNSGNCTVPEDEQDCIKYDDNKKCIQRSCPTLAGENISSVKIHGNYLVLFVYSGLTDRSSGPWTFCQEFPSIDDANKLGPQQMKWQNIRNSNKNVIPNYVVIIPYVAS